MAKQPIPIPDATSVGDLEIKCNFIEANLPGNLLSLEALNNPNEKVTKGIFNRLPDVVPGLGKLKIKPDNSGTNTAWINGIKIKVSFK